MHLNSISQPKKKPKIFPEAPPKAKHDNFTLLLLWHIPLALQEKLTHFEQSFFGHDKVEGNGLCNVESQNAVR